MEWAKATARFIKANDRYKHPVTVHPVISSSTRVTTPRSLFDPPWRIGGFFGEGDEIRRVAEDGHRETPGSVVELRVQESQQEAFSRRVIAGGRRVEAALQVKLDEENAARAFRSRKQSGNRGLGVPGPEELVRAGHGRPFEWRKANRARVAIPADQPFGSKAKHHGMGRRLAQEHA